MMKNINYCIVTACALAIQLGLLQNCATAQSGHSIRGGYVYGDSGETIELIPYGNPAAFEEPQKSYYQSQNTPEKFGNVFSYNAESNSDRQRNPFYESDRYQRPSSRPNFNQTRAAERGSYRKRSKPKSELSSKLSRVSSTARATSAA